MATGPGARAHPLARLRAHRFDPSRPPGRKSARFTTTSTSGWSAPPGSHSPWARTLVVFFVVQAIPWSMLHREEAPTLVTSIDQAPEEVFEDPVEEVEQEVEEDEPIEEPVLMEDVPTEMDDIASEEDFEYAEGDPDMSADSPLRQHGLQRRAGDRWRRRRSPRRSIRWRGCRTEGRAWNDHRDRVRPLLAEASPERGGLLGL